MHARTSASIKRDPCDVRNRIKCPKYHIKCNFPSNKAQLSWAEKLNIIRGQVQKHMKAGIGPCWSSVTKTRINYNRIQRYVHYLGRTPLNNAMQALKMALRRNSDTENWFKFCQLHAMYSTLYIMMSVMH
ncbi:hypothetical protein HELRODRAFT_165812 [Helobdella robusta]|uniref:Uncharacterized protein n=1 Tax=Helobdella robusta TaxID=6412 RepID=T1EXB2_HELRO|nr:hypothetical protein HELRODRAFT_165812 [Helobdella robusta]ESN91744.1 hypothetical protein HELRODRAFT_165812 [Helobdella robusta]